MQLAVADVFRARWTDEIHDEWIRSLLRDRPALSVDRLAVTRQRMNAHVRDCLVTGYGSLIPTLSLPDADDRHVLAAAIHCGADAILTFNLSDFLVDALAPHGIEAVHPDAFLQELLALNPEDVCAAMRRQRLNLKNPPLAVESLLGILERQGLSNFVSQLNTYRDQL